MIIEITRVSNGYIAQDLGVARYGVNKRTAVFQTYKKLGEYIVNQCKETEKAERLAEKIRKENEEKKRKAEAERKKK